MTHLVLLAVLSAASGLQLRTALFEARPPPLSLFATAGERLPPGFGFGQVPPPPPNATPAPQASAPTSYDVIRTKDGKVRVGTLLQETEKGYLFRTAEGETLVVEFKTIDDIQRTGGASVPAQGTGKPGAVSPPAPPGLTQPPPYYPAPYNYDPLMVEKERKRLRLEATLRDLESKLAQASYGTAIFELIAGVAVVGLALFVFNGDPFFQLILLIGGGLNLVIGGVRLAFVAYDRSKLGEQIDLTRGELGQISLLRPLRLAPSSLITLAEF